MRQSTRMIWGCGLTLALMSGRGFRSRRSADGADATAPVDSVHVRRRPLPVLLRDCHGREGKGDGPVASALNRRPPDLTTIARRNGGRFPTDRVERFVTGDREPTLAHGSADMPVWGPIFQALDPQDRMNRIRIENVVAFIESIQAK